jgi:signal transduction histidine kinase
MIRLEDLYAFIESNYDFLLAVDEGETVIHASALIRHGRDPKRLRIEGQHLTDFLTPASLQSFRSGMARARESVGGMVVFAPLDQGFTSTTLRAGYVPTEHGSVFVFFGAQIDGLSQMADEDREERIKELSCLYTVAEWIEASTSIKEFFTRLPDYLRRGMRYQDDVVVYSIYQGHEYGRPIEGSNYLRVKLVVNQQVGGEIRVGYESAEQELLPEEQRMLDEIGRMLSVALERKELSERLALKHEEEEASRKHLAQLEAEIKRRTQEIDDQRHKLDTINSYLERVNRSWDESKSWLETVLKGIPDPVALIDRHRTLVMTNKESVQPGEKCHKKLFGRDVPCQDCRLARVIRDRAPITLAIQHEDKHYEVHALPIFSPDHEVDGIMEFYRDVTLQRSYEQQLRHADQMASLGQLVSGIGHEINNPNQFIRGNVKIIKQALEDILPIVDGYQREHPDLKIARLPYAFFREHVMTMVDDMGHGSERIKAIVEGLKRFARRDEGLLIDTVDVNTLVEACLRLVYNEVHKHAEIKLELDPSVPAFIGNSQKIEQVLVNLIVNASQAMPEEKPGLIVVRTRTEDGHAVLEVEDNGKGMNEKTQKQIFDPFFTTKRAKGGTGLGLAIAYRIIEEHGGAISVRSRLGEGSTFTVRIPMRGGAAKSANEAKGTVEGNGTAPTRG